MSNDIGHETTALDSVSLSSGVFSYVQSVQDDGEMEPRVKRPKIEIPQIFEDDAGITIQQLLYDINRTLCERLDAIESRLETVDRRTRYLESKFEQFVKRNGTMNHFTPGGTDNQYILNKTGPCRPYLSTRTSNGAIVIGVPQEKPSPDDECSEMALQPVIEVDHGVQMDSLLQQIGPNVTLITLNTEEDVPNGSWLGDENNLSMRVRVNISSSDLLHVHATCRTPEKMALALLDYLFDRDVQASSNLSGIGKHGKKQLDPLLIYGIRCHLIHRFSITDDDWRKLKLNIDSKCRTAYRRKVRGMPLTVKAFRSKSATTFMHRTSPSEEGAGDTVGGTCITLSYDDPRLFGDVQQASDDSLQQDDAEMMIQESINGGRYRILHATPEQVAQLQQTHQIQILHTDQILLQQAMNGTDSDGSDGIARLTDGHHIVVTNASGIQSQDADYETDSLIHRDNHV